MRAEWKGRGGIRGTREGGNSVEAMGGGSTTSLRICFGIVLTTELC